MKTLKKTLCLVLAVVMVVGVLILPAYAADDYDDATDALQHYGVLQGYPDGKLHTDANITRGQMAAIIYRIMTGDVKSTDAQVSTLYGSYANGFTDADVAPWAKGYIGFCANKGVLKGYDTGAVQPNKQITGYEVRAMLLRALGYDKNNEYTGNDWQKYVLSDSTKTGIDKGVTVDPALVTPRGAVAQLAYNAATQTDMVGLRILPNVDYASVGKKLISTVSSEATSDDFGMPQTKTKISFNWPDTAVTKEFTVDAELLGRWYTPVVECDVAAAADIDDAEDFATYTNGAKNEDEVEINPTDEKTTIGAYGRETSLYEGNVIVYKDVVLAKIDKVTPAITDNAGHEITAASYSVTVYYGHDGTGYTVTTTSALGTTTTFAKGDMVRAYCVVKESTKAELDASDVTFTKLSGATKVTPTQVTVNSIIENTAEDELTGFKGTDGVTYTYANTYSYKKGTLVKLKDTDLGTTWGVYTDGHNNVLSIVPADTTKGYGVVTDVDAEKIAFNKYSAKLTILTKDGKTVTVQVLDDDDKSYFGSEAAVAEAVEDKGYLNALVTYEANTEPDAPAGFTKIVTDKTKSATIPTNSDGDEVVYAGAATAIDSTMLVNDDTVFFIAQYSNSASKGGYTANGYKVVKGFKNIKDLSHDDLEKVDNKEVELAAYAIDSGSDNWAEYVLIIGATTVADDKKEDVKNYALLFNRLERTETYDLYDAVINGVKTTLKLQAKASAKVTDDMSLYTYTDRNTNGAYGDVENVKATNQVAEAVVTAGVKYKAGAMETTASDLYRAVADDVKVYFVNPDTGKSTESKYDLETVLTAGFSIDSIYFQTDEYGFIDLVYVISDAAPDTEPDKHVDKIELTGAASDEIAFGDAISDYGITTKDSSEKKYSVSYEWQQMIGNNWTKVSGTAFGAGTFRIVITVTAASGYDFENTTPVTVEKDHFHIPTPSTVGKAGTTYKITGNAFTIAAPTAG